MGILSRLGFGSSVVEYADALPYSHFATPFAEGSHLNPVIAGAEIFGRSAEVVTREEAMAIPAVSRGRDLIAPVLARLPLVAYKAGVALSPQPNWLTNSMYLPVRLRTLFTADDLIFEGRCLWFTDRGLPDSSGRKQILDAFRVRPDQWRIQDDQIVMSTRDGHERTLDEDEYILFLSSTDALLTKGARSIRGARRLEERWLERIENPIPVVEIRYTGDEDLTPEEQTDIRTKYLTARGDPSGVVMVTPKGFEVHPHGDNAVELFVEGRNAVALDMARFMNLPASMIDASQTNGSSVDYENGDIGRSAYYDTSLRTWALPFEESLSQDDVVAHGTYVAFDFSSITSPDTGAAPVRED